MKTGNKCFFFDRDGIINKRIMCGYVYEPSEFTFVEGFIDFFREVQRQGFMTIIITNQQGVGKGFMTSAELDSLHSWMQQELYQYSGGYFTAIYSATELQGQTPQRRKPSPAMLLEAAQDFAINLSLSHFIGDTPSDVAAGKAAGVRTWFVAPPDQPQAEADYMFASLTEACQHLYNASN